MLKEHLKKERKIKSEKNLSLDLQDVWTFLYSHLCPKRNLEIFPSDLLPHPKSEPQRQEINTSLGNWEASFLIPVLSMYLVIVQFFPASSSLLYRAVSLHFFVFHMGNNCYYVLPFCRGLIKTYCASHSDQIWGQVSETEVRACALLEEKHIFMFPFSTWKADGWSLRWVPGRNSWQIKTYWKWLEVLMSIWKKQHFWKKGKSSSHT